MRPDFPKCLVHEPIHREPTAGDVATEELRAIAQFLGIAASVPLSAHDSRALGSLIRRTLTERRATVTGRWAT